MYIHGLNENSFVICLMCNTIKNQFSSYLQLFRLTTSMSFPFKIEDVDSAETQCILANLIDEVSFGFKLSLFLSFIVKISKAFSSFFCAKSCLGDR